MFDFTFLLEMLYQQLFVPHQKKTTATWLTTSYVTMVLML